MESVINETVAEGIFHGTSFAVAVETISVLVAVRHGQERVAVRAEIVAAVDIRPSAIYIVHHKGRIAVADVIRSASGVIITLPQLRRHETVRIYVVALAHIFIIARVCVIRQGNNDIPFTVQVIAVFLPSDILFTRAVEYDATVCVHIVCVGVFIREIG